MELVELHVRRQQYGKDQGKLMGEITFDTQYAKTTLHLSEERAQQMLNLVAAELVDDAKRVGAGLINEISVTRAIEAKKDAIID